MGFWKDRGPARARAHRGRSRHHRSRWLPALLVALTGAAVLAIVAIALSADSGGDGPPRPFVASAGSSPATVWAVGDSADGTPRAGRVADLIGRNPGAKLLYLGDVYERGTAEEWERNYEPLYGRFAASTAPTPGNHEWYLRDDGYRSYWSRKKGRDVPDYYDFSIAGWQILSLNSELELEEAEDDEEQEDRQENWLESRLREPGDCRLAFMHTSRYTAGSHDDEPKLDTLWRPLRGKATAVVSAHDHNMQRLEPQHGITPYISGAGGHSLYALNEEDPRLEFSNDTDDGALRIDLRPGKADFTFVDTDGRVLDRSSVTCTP